LSENNWSLSNKNAILLAYFFVIFGIVGGINTNTALQTYSWVFSGTNAPTSIFLEEPNLDNIEVWYFLTGLIFFIFFPPFVGWFVYDYFRTQIKLTSIKRSILEFFYLSLAGVFTVVPLRVARILPIWGAQIHPNYIAQQDFMISKASSMGNWTLGTYEIPVEEYNVEPYFTIVLIGIYFGFFYLLRRWRIHVDRNN